MYDLSLAEIAEPEGNTRQSVYAQVRKVKQKLDEYEKKLKLYEKNDKLFKLAEKVCEIDPELGKQIKELAGR
jgi:predicted DNA-binding protein YlxM (UPF0122 family)